MSKSGFTLIVSLQIITTCRSYFTGGGGTNFEQAQAYCESQGTTLASIHSAADFQFARATCKQEVDQNGGIGCFIGLNNIIGSEFYQNIDDTDIDYGFDSDGTPQTGMAPWCTNQPQTSNDRYCVHMPTSLDYCLNAIPCGRAYKALCNNEYFVGPEELTHYEAAQYCESQGSVLASIHSDIEFERAKNICRNTVDSKGGHSWGCWIGIIDDNGGEEGMFRNMDETQIGYGFNVDGTATVGVKPWASGEPNEAFNGEDCVHLDKGKDYYYNDNDCNYGGFFPLCAVV